MRNRTVVIVLATGLGVSAVEAADRLPFPDGTYASKKEYCTLTREAAVNRDEGAFLDIRGTQLRFYEASCEIRNVSEKGKTIKFKTVCESEGETEVKRVTWTRLSKSSFKTEYGDTYIACGLNKQNGEANEQGGNEADQSVEKADSKKSKGELVGAPSEKSNYNGLTLGLPIKNLTKLSNVKLRRLDKNTYQLMLGDGECGEVTPDKGGNISKMRLSACWFGLPFGSKDFLEKATKHSQFRPSDFQDMQGIGWKQTAVKNSERLTFSRRESALFIDPGIEVEECNCAVDLEPIAAAPTSPATKFNGLGIGQTVDDVKALPNVSVEEFDPTTYFVNLGTARCASFNLEQGRIKSLRMKPCWFNLPIATPQMEFMQKFSQAYNMTGMGFLPGGTDPTFGGVYWHGTTQYNERVIYFENDREVGVVMSSAGNFN